MKIQKIGFHYLWLGHWKYGGIPLAKWSTIAAPKYHSGWGLKIIYVFTQYLVGRDLWRLAQGSSLWTRVMNSKHFHNISIIDWLCLPRKSSKGSIV
jgi:hypothetical protein